MLAVSTICYLHGKVLGLEQAAKVIQAQIAGQTVNGAPVPKAVETIRHLGQLFGDLEEIAIRIDPNGSNLAKARARALGWAHKTGASVWVCCDDDVTASPGTLQTLVRVCRDAETPTVLVVPCALRAESSRNAASVNVWPASDTKYPAGSARITLPLKWGGFGLVAMNRAALELIVKRRPSFEDDDGSAQPLVFNCELQGTIIGGGGAPANELAYRWLGEDLSFFEQVRPLGVECLMLTRGESDHAGAVIDLASVGALFCEP